MSRFMGRGSVFAAIAVSALVSACSDRPNLVEPARMIAPAAASKTTFQATGIQELTKAPTTRLIAISQSGAIVGSMVDANGNTHAFLWTPTTKMRDLGALGAKNSTSIARGVNSSGTVVGESTDGVTGLTHAFIWTAAGGMRDLTPGSASMSVANGINDLGQIVGKSGSGKSIHAWMWNPSAHGGAASVDLGTLGGVTSEAFAINSSGQIAGGSDTRLGARLAFFWTPAGGMLNLGAAGGSESGATAINDAGQVVGWTISGAGSLPFIWSAADGIQILGTMKGLSHIVATGINSRGEVVGKAWQFKESIRAFYWTRDGRILQDLTEPLGLTAAVGINDARQVIGGDQSVRTIVPIGNVPFATPLEFSTTVNVPATLSMPMGRDMDLRIYSYSISIPASKELPLSLTGSGATFTLTPPPAFAGDITLTYVIKTQWAVTSDPSTITIHVNPAAAPVTPGGAYYAQTGTTIQIQPPATDPQNQSLTFTVAAKGDVGTMNTSTMPWTYTPPAGFIGTALFSYTATNQSGLKSTPGVLTITVGPCPFGYFDGGAGCVENVPGGPGGPGGGPTSPTPCSAGQYSSSGSTPCTPAPAGTYVSSTGATSATPCAAGLTTRQVGSVSADACVAFTASEVEMHATAAVNTGAITGVGSSAASTVSDWLNKLDQASTEIGKGQTRPACNHLYQAYALMDPTANDRVTGSAATMIAAELKATYSQTGCVAIMPNSLPF